MADPDTIYRNEFSVREQQQHAREFENGIPDSDFITIQTSNARRAAQGPNANYNNALSYPARQQQSFGTFRPPTAQTAFQFVSFQFAPATKAKAPRRAPKKKAPAKTSKKSARKNYDDVDCDVSLSHSEQHTESSSEFRLGVDDNDCARRILRSGAKKKGGASGAAIIEEPDGVASKEVFVDGGAPPAPRIEFVSVRSAVKMQMKQKIGEMLGDDGDLLDSSCDELEREIAEKSKHNAKRKRARPHKRAEFSGAAPESLEGLSNSDAGSVDDDDDDDDEGNAFQDSIDTSTKKRRGAVGGAGGGGGGDGDDNEPPGSGVARTGASGRHLASAMNCFLCRFGSRKHDSVNRKDMNELRDVLESGIGHKDVVALAKTVHKQYMNTIWVNGGGNVPLWRTKHVLEHILYHDNDPRIYQWLALNSTKRLMEIVEDTVLARDPVSGAVMPTNNMGWLLKLREEARKLYKEPPETMNFYLPAAKIDINKANKRVEGVVWRRGPRHYAHREAAEQAIE